MTNNDITSAEFKIKQCGEYIAQLTHFSEDAIDFCSYIATLMTDAGNQIHHEICTYEYCDFAEHKHIEQKEIDEAHLQIRLILS